MEELKIAVYACLKSMDLQQKKQDFVHLLFNECNAERVLHFESVIQGL